MPKNEEFHKTLVRPTVIITTISKNGILNAVPFSFSISLVLSHHCSVSPVMEEHQEESRVSD
jgi:flavin reductase (DIM6/NTAB) family NADH-FMN oxidoreductase RutF